MRHQSYRFFFFLALGICLTTSIGRAVDTPWAVSFDAGSVTPTEDFNTVMDNDMVYGMNVDYLGMPHLGLRIAYDHQEFEYDHFTELNPLQIDSLSLTPLIYYDFPEWIRVFGLIGPTFYSAKNHEPLNWGADQRDIGWNGGIGFEFYPIPKWGVRFQSVYHSAELGTGRPRASWVANTVGLTFKF